ncbi:LacI family DNA-binding transcriptional regulator [Candidatus Izemoplasma sp. B36]|uniref:LacI family DNA-binding transcriptional regulator n=1 Tax=Candidatus Izemoplasma sp. B36 TaxID=3242468 RepID=UPI0035570437
MVTIKDVAKKAGHSISTVSYALNNDSRISEKTANKIKEIAKEMNYFPSAAARNLKRKTTKTIFVAISDFGGPVYNELLDGIHHELAKNDYTMIVSTGVSTDKILKQRGSDASIISDINITDKFLVQISNGHSPIFVLDRSLKGNNIYNLTIDNLNAMFELTEDIIKKGYKRIAFVHGVIDSYDNKTRFEGFLKAMNAFNLNVYKEYKGSFTKESGYKIADEIINDKQRPDMLVCSNDEMALGIIEKLQLNNILIPEEIGISGFDDIELSKYFSPRLTSIKVDHFNWGRRIAKTILNLLKGKDIVVKKEKGTLVKRESY